MNIKFHCKHAINPDNQEKANKKNAEQKTVKIEFGKGLNKICAYLHDDSDLIAVCLCCANGHVWDWCERMFVENFSIY